MSDPGFSKNSAFTSLVPKNRPAPRPAIRNPGGLGRFFQRVQQRAVAGQLMNQAGLPPGIPSPLDQMDLTDINNIRQETANAIAEYQQRVAAANAEADYSRRELGQQISTADAARRLGIPATQAVYDDEQNQLRDVFSRSLQGYQQGAANVGNAYAQGVAAQQDNPQAQSLEQQLQALMGDGGNLANDINSNNRAYRDLLSSAGQQGQASLQQLGMANNSGDLSSLAGYASERDQNLSDYNLAADAAIRQLQNQQAVVQPEFIPFNLADLQTRENESIQAVMRQAFADQKDEEDKNNRYTGLEGARQYADSIGRPDLYQWLSENLQTAGAAGQDPQALYTLIPQTNEGWHPDLEKMVNDFANSGGGFHPRITNGPGSTMGITLGHSNPSPEEVANYRRTLAQTIANVNRIAGGANNVANRDSENLRRLLNIYMGNYANYAQ